MSLSAPTPLAHFTRLNPSVWYHKASSSPSLSTTSKEPTIILLVGWMAASPRHLSKYTSGYEALYPSASIIAITTTALDAILWTEAATIKRVEPALEILYDLPDDARLLVHFFSNGGAFTTSRIAAAYKERMKVRLPMRALVMDSTPGRATYAATVRAFAVSLPKDILSQALGGLVLRAAWCAYVLGYMVQGRVDLVEATRRALNDKRVFKAEANRLYVYSVKDDMVAWKLVEEHADDAEAKGYVVDREKYGESGHCGHLIVDADRYWGAVHRLWSTVS